MELIFLIIYALPVMLCQQLHIYFNTGTYESQLSGASEIYITDEYAESIGISQDALNKVYIRKYGKRPTYTYYHSGPSWQDAYDKNCSECTPVVRYIKPLKVKIGNVSVTHVEKQVTPYTSDVVLRVLESKQSLKSWWSLNGNPGDPQHINVTIDMNVLTNHGKTRFNIRTKFGQDSELGAPLSMTPDFMPNYVSPNRKADTLRADIKLVMVKLGAEIHYKSFFRGDAVAYFHNRVRGINLVSMKAAQLSKMLGITGSIIKQHIALEYCMGAYINVFSGNELMYEVIADAHQYHGAEKIHSFLQGQPSFWIRED